MKLDNALAPIRVEQFLGDYVGRRHLLARGARGRFDSLVTLPSLGDELSRLRVGEQRVRLVRAGANVPRGEYVHASRAGTGEYLNGSAVTRLVLDGASLVVNQVDELLPEIRELAESCEQVFRIYVSANLYAGWRRERGFDVHWDRHDTLILQVVGRKDWTVWEPTHLHPLMGEPSHVISRPTGAPAWEGVLEDGDLLYMPRGWWHVACPRDEPSVHITFSLKHPTGVDLVEWMMIELRAVQVARMDVPHWKSRDDQLTWLTALRNACAAALSDDALDRFMMARDGDAHTRPVVRLPLTSDPLSAEIDDQAALRLVRGRRLHLTQHASTIAFQAQGSTWQCHYTLGPAMALLNHLTPCTVAEMESLLDVQGRLLLRPFLRILLDAHVIWRQPVAQKMTTT